MRTYEIEDGCVGCPSEMGCLGSSCPNKNIRVYSYFCDKCGDACDPEELYIVDDEELCSYCVLGNFPTVAQEEE